MTRLLVCGARDWDDMRIVSWVLTGAFHEETVGFLTVDCEHLWIIEGGAKGADAVAAWWARDDPLHGPYATEASALALGDEAGVVHRRYPAKWYAHDFDGRTGVQCSRTRCTEGELCRLAGPRRNLRMLNEERPEIVVAFKDNHDRSLRKGGTENMIRIAKERGITTYVVSHG